MSNTWKRLGLMVVGASLLGALALGGAALAQTPTPDDDTDGTDTMPRFGQMMPDWSGDGMGMMGPMMGQMFGFGGMHQRGGMMFGFEHGMGGGLHMGGLGLDIVADQLGLTEAELTEALSDGETTVADLASEQGIELATIVDAVLARTGAYLDVAVQYGRLTQTEADQMLALMETRLTARFSTPAGANSTTGTVAGLLDMTAQELTDALSDGETTVASLAEAQGVELQTIVDALLAPTKDYLAVAVQYEQVTQAQADALIAKAETVINAWLSKPLGGQPNGGLHHQFEFRFDRGHRMGPGMHGHFNFDDGGEDSDTGTQTAPSFGGTLL